MNNHTDQLIPVYKLKEVASTSQGETWSDLETIGKAITEGWIVFWQHHRVFTGRITGGAIQWLPAMGGIPEPGREHFVRLRAFNSTREYHFWNSKQGIKGRLRIDAEGANTECVDTRMVLRSVIAGPLQTSPVGFDPSKPIAVITRNYIGYHPETQQAGYVDSRFVDFYKTMN